MSTKPTAPKSNAEITAEIAHALKYQIFGAVAPAFGKTEVEALAAHPVEVRPRQFDDRSLVIEIGGKLVTVSISVESID